MIDVLPITAADIDEVVMLVYEFVESRAHHPAGVSPMAVAEYLAAGVGGPGMIGYKAVRDGKTVGILFGIIGPDWMSGKVVAQEQIWYVQEGETAGLPLLRAFIAEARRRGAAFVVSGYIPQFMGRRIATVLERTGFREVESWWVKGLE